MLRFVAEADIRAPPPFLWELANVLLMAERRGRITAADRCRFLDLVVQLDLGIDPADPSVVWHDAAYLELAMRGGVPLASRDNALLEAARTCGLTLLAC